MRAFSCGLLLACTILLVRAETPVPATVEFLFDNAQPQGIRTVKSGETTYLASVSQSGGKIAKGWWHVPATVAFGQGQLRIDLDRQNLAGDLALILHADWQEETDVVVQLLDAQGRALALDLFGEMHHNAQSVGTDTFVLPLERYPDATTVLVRRLNGELRVSGIGLFPVLSEVTSKAENEKALAAQLGLILSPHHWVFSAASREVPGNVAENSLGEVHTVPALEKSNAIGAAILKQPNYPAYRPLTGGPLLPPKMAMSNTTDYLIRPALRILGLRGDGKPAKVFWTSSSGVAELLLKEQYDLGIMSVPLSSAEKEKFYALHHYPAVELRLAHDALQMLVNANNPVRALTIPQLDAIFGKELRAGAPRLVTDWSAVGGSGGAIHLVGGDKSYGTTRTFQKLVLQGGEFRPGMKETDVVYADGVEKEVADDPAAIGFATLRPRRPEVRALAVAPNSGEEASSTNADDIYSGRYPLQRFFYAYVAARSLESSGAYQRELVNLLLSDMGQTLVARGGSLPLMASEVVAERKRLGLPQ